MSVIATLSCANGGKLDEVKLAPGAMQPTSTSAKAVTNSPAIRNRRTVALREPVDALAAVCIDSFMADIPFLSLLTALPDSIGRL